MLFHALHIMYHRVFNCKGMTGIIAVTRRLLRLLWLLVCDQEEINHLMRDMFNFWHAAGGIVIKQESHYLIRDLPQFFCAGRLHENVES